MRFDRLSRRGAPALLVLLLVVLPAALRAQDRPPADTGAYLLEAGDLVEIRVYGEPQLTVRLRVPPQGSVSFPLISNVGLLGRSPTSVEEEIASRLAANGILKAPNVSVLVQEFAPRTVFVLGSVQHPGSFDVPVGRPLLLSHAVSMAGGFLEKADLSRVQVIRTSTGKAQTFVVAFPSDGSSTPEMYMMLEPGDQILVPSLGFVYVVGEVSRPGQVMLKPGEDLRVSQVMALAGSFQERVSDLEDIRILRRTGSQVRTITVNLKNYLAGTAQTDDPAVLANDVIFVKRR